MAQDIIALSLTCPMCLLSFDEWTFFLSKYQLYSIYSSVVYDDTSMSLNVNKSVMVRLVPIHWLISCFHGLYTFVMLLWIYHIKQNIRALKLVCHVLLTTQYLNNIWLKRIILCMVWGTLKVKVPKKSCTESIAKASDRIVMSKKGILPETT